MRCPSHMSFVFGLRVGMYIIREIRELVYKGTYEYEYIGHWTAGHDRTRSGTFSQFLVRWYVETRIWYI